MTSEFFLYLRLGFEHISDLKGYDHIVFIVALCAVYSLRQWKNLLWLVTAFTIGHSVTLALSTLDIVSVATNLIEFLIPVTILIASGIDLYESWTERQIRPGDVGRAPKMGVEFRHSFAWNMKYALALLFGLIHGLGFSNFLRAVLGAEENIVIPLLAFNVGLEMGQLAILLVVLTVSLVIVKVTRLSHRNWALVLSVVTAGIGASMLYSRFFSL